MGIVESILARYFGNQVLKWFKDTGEKMLKKSTSEKKAREILQRFILDTNAEDRIDQYLAEIDRLDQAHPRVKGAREVIVRTKKRAKKKMAVGFRRKKKAKLQKKKQPKIRRKVKRPNKKRLAKRRKK